MAITLDSTVTLDSTSVTLDIGVTVATRLKLLSGLSNATVSAMLLAIGVGATVGAVLVNYSGLPTGTVSQHLMVDKIAQTAPIIQSGGEYSKGKIRKPIPLIIDTDEKRRREDEAFMFSTLL